MILTRCTELPPFNGPWRRLYDPGVSNSAKVLRPALTGTGAVLTHYMPPLRKIERVEAVAAADPGE
jgi:hypothetical protein